MDSALEQLVWRRAGGRCEYCHVPQSADDLPFHIDHIIARQHGGRTVASNLAAACYACNLHKGPNLSGRDRVTGKTVRLFHPRRHRWHRHFRWTGAVLVGATAVGRATVATLGMNAPWRVELREHLMAEGLLRIE
jgi:HNH endonuclease